MPNILEENPEFLIALGFMISTSAAVVWTGSRRGVATLLQKEAAILRGGSASEIGPYETLTAADAAQFPLNGSLVLFTLYVLLKYIPAAYVSTAMGFYLGIFATIALNYVVRPLVPFSSTQSSCISAATNAISDAIIIADYNKNGSAEKKNNNKKEKKNANDKKNDISVEKGNNKKKAFKPLLALVAVAAVATGVSYLTTKHWILTNVLAIATGIVAIEMVPLGSFSVASLLLVGLFFYDIFWVFGTDVMVAVATSVDGPIKILFPQAVLSWKTPNMSLLGLGDIVVPGFFIAFIAAFSYNRRRFALQYKKEQQEKKQQEQKKQEAAAATTKKNNNNNNIASPVSAPFGDAFYLIVAMAAYVLSLVNTMAIMVFFGAAQPALLYIVPWLLIVISLTALMRRTDGVSDWTLLLAFHTAHFIDTLSSSSSSSIPADEESNKKKQDNSNKGDTSSPPPAASDSNEQQQQEEMTTTQALGEFVGDFFGYVTPAAITMMPTA